MLGKPLGWFKISEIRENSNILKFSMQTRQRRTAWVGVGDIYDQLMWQSCGDKNQNMKFLNYLIMFLSFWQVSRAIIERKNSNVSSEISIKTRKGVKLTFMRNPGTYLSSPFCILFCRYDYTHICHTSDTGKRSDKSPIHLNTSNYQCV